MRKITIVFHSGYGHTRRVAEHVEKGVASGDVTVEKIAINSDGNLPEAAWRTLQDSDGIIFGTPTYMGGPSWQFKKFADASSKQWFAMAWKGKVAAGFTNSASMNGDKEFDAPLSGDARVPAWNALERFGLETGQLESVDARRYQPSRRLCRPGRGFPLRRLGRRNAPWRSEDGRSFRREFRRGDEAREQRDHELKKSGHVHLDRARSRSSARAMRRRLSKRKPPTNQRWPREPNGLRMVRGSTGRISVARATPNALGQSSTGSPPGISARFFSMSCMTFQNVRISSRVIPSSEADIMSMISGNRSSMICLPSAVRPT